MSEPLVQVIETVDALRERYRQPTETSLAKEVDHLDVHCRDFLAHSPFVVLSTVAPDGRVDVSPKGGTPGFVAVLDEHRLAIPDMSGNNRLDSLRNIVGDAGAGKVAVLALVPGIGETLRVNGTARVTTDPAVLDACPVDGKRPRVAVVVEVDTAFLHCAKALRRSGIWEPERWPSTDDMASTACMLHDHIGLTTPVAATEERLAQSYAATTWEMGGVDPS